MLYHLDVRCIVKEVYHCKDIQLSILTPISHTSQGRILLVRYIALKAHSVKAYYNCHILAEGKSDLVQDIYRVYVSRNN